MNPRISIVTLSFNQAVFLPACLDSVAPQLAPGDEHLCIDPGSTDGSRELLLARGSGIASVLEPDRGAADGLNKGFARARGDVLAFLNADDALAAGALAYVRQFFAEHPETTVLLGAVRFMDGAGRAERRRRISTRPSLLRLRTGTQRFYQQGMFFRRELWDRGVRFNIANRTCWDWEFFVDAVLAGASVATSAKVLGYFRVHAASITGRKDNRVAYEGDYRRILAKVPPAAVSPARQWLHRAVAKVDPFTRLKEFLP